MRARFIEILLSQHAQVRQRLVHRTACYQNRRSRQIGSLHRSSGKSRFCHEHHSQRRHLPMNPHHFINFYPGSNCQISCSSHFILVHSLLIFYGFLVALPASVSRIINSCDQWVNYLFVFITAKFITETLLTLAGFAVMLGFCWNVGCVR